MHSACGGAHGGDGRGIAAIKGVVKKQPAKRRRIPEKGVLRFIMSDVMLVDSFKLKRAQ